MVEGDDRSDNAAAKRSGRKGNSYPSMTLSRGRDPMSPRAQALSRIPSGHPEGYFESFANIYSTYITALAKKLRGETLAPADLDFPTVDDGLRGVRYIEACVESSAKGAIWVAIECEPGGIPGPGSRGNTQRGHR